MTITPNSLYYIDLTPPPPPPIPVNLVGITRRHIPKRFSLFSFVNSLLHVYKSPAAKSELLRPPDYPADSSTDGIRLWVWRGVFFL
jgi:hypothetical protein